MEPIKIPATILESEPSALYASGRMWIIASPRRAPKARLKKNLILISKQLSEASFLQLTSTNAVRNPMADIPNPAKNPNPHLSDSFRVTELA
jgi:hypothetical protein